jgi:hypothetical protein
MDTIYSKAWLNYNCTQGNNWIISYKFDEIIAHEGRRVYKISGDRAVQIPETTLALTAKDLSHIYFTYMTEEVLITLVETYDGQLYLIHNRVTISEAPDELVQLPQVQLPVVHSVDSNIYKLTNISQIKHCLTKKERTVIGVKNLGQLKENQKNDLGFMSFINVSETQKYVQQLNQYIGRSGETLNLIHNYSVTPDKLSQVDIQPNIKQLILYQNFQINDFEWLQKFPNIKLLNLFYNHQLEQKHIEQITRVLPTLEVVNIHFCSRINVRILIPLLKLRNLTRLAIEDPQFWCQKSIHELFIAPHEWENIFCPSISKVAINSCNLTMDVIDYLLKACPNITQMTVEENVLKLLSENMEGGLEKNDPLVVNSWQNPNKGFQIQKKIMFKNLLKNTYNSEMFSESMLKKIREIKTRKGEVEQTGIDDKSSPNKGP